MSVDKAIADRVIQKSEEGLAVKATDALYIAMIINYAKTNPKKSTVAVIGAFVVAYKIFKWKYPDETE